MNLDQHIIQTLCALAGVYGIERIVLFGSRARGTNHSRSDIDLAVWGIRDAAQYFDLREDIEVQIPTLLRFDLVDMDGISVSDDLRREIEKDGVVLYEKI